MLTKAFRRCLPPFRKEREKDGAPKVKFGGSSTTLAPLREENPAFDHVPTFAKNAKVGHPARGLTPRFDRRPFESLGQSRFRRQV